MTEGKCCVMVSSAASNTGMHIVERLIKHKDKFSLVGSIFSKDSDNQGAALRSYQDALKTVAVDGMDITTLNAAFKQHQPDVLVLIPVGHANRITIAKNYLSAAKQANVKNILLVSTSMAPKKDYLFAEQFAEIEEALKAMSSSSSSNIQTSSSDEAAPVWTVIRPCFYMENLLLYDKDIQQGVLKLPTGEGKFAPVATADVGKFVEAILLSWQNHHRKAYELTGPLALSGAEMASAASKALNRPIRFENISDDEAAALLNSRGIPEGDLPGWRQFYMLVREGKKSDVLVDDFERIAKCKPETLERFWLQHASRLTPQSASMASMPGTMSSQYCASSNPCA